MSGRCCWCTYGSRGFIHWDDNVSYDLIFELSFDRMTLYSFTRIILEAVADFFFFLENVWDGIAKRKQVRQKKLVVA